MPGGMVTPLAAAALLVAELSMLWKFAIRPSMRNRLFSITLILESIVAIPVAIATVPAICVLMFDSCWPIVCMIASAPFILLSRALMTSLAPASTALGGEDLALPLAGVGDLSLPSEVAIVKDRGLETTTSGYHERILAKSTLFDTATLEPERRWFRTCNSR